MRHGISGNRLQRNRSLLKATMRDVAKSTLEHQRICTTKAKAKEARKLVDRLITLGKKGTLAARRRAFAILCDHQLVSNLFNKIAPRFRERQGGYTRIITLGLRRGDGAQLTYLELTEKEVVISKPKATAAAKTKKSTKAVPSKAKEESVPEVKAEKKPDQPKTEQKMVGKIKKIFRSKTAE